MPSASTGSIRVGVGGWTFEPWRGSFYPEDLTQKRELAYASSRLSSIEINGTYYGSQKPASFARWHDETPEGFVFTVKGPRFATNRGVLADAGPSIERFFASGVLNLADKLGPINWQFLPGKRFQADDFEAFLKLLPTSIDGRAIRHVVEVRHASFATPEFVSLLRRYGIGAVFTDHQSYPNIADVTAGFVYARLQRCSEEEETGYAPDALDRWAERARMWARGKAPEDLGRLDEAESSPAKPRDVFVYMINGFKPKCPTAAMALIQRLS